MNKTIIGNLIKDRREFLGITQDILCTGICSHSTLSRIEQGDFGNNWNTVIKLFERLGFSEMTMYEVLSDDDLDISLTIHEASRLYILQKRDEAGRLLDSISDRYESFSIANKQHYDSMHTLLLERNGDIDEATSLSMHEKILRMTWKDYSPDNLPPLMTREEIFLLNSIALLYDRLGQKDISIRILIHIKDFLLKQDPLPNEIVSTLSMVLYNLAKRLYQVKRYEECIELSKLGIELERTHGRAYNYAKHLYNYSYCLVQLGNPEDLPLAKSLAKDAYDLYRITEIYPHLLEDLKEWLDSFE